MVSLALKLQPESLRLSERGVVTGVLCFAVGNRHFPDPSWNDFVVVVLSWWCGALLRVRSGARGIHELRFMDGPFMVQLEQISATRELRLQFLHQDGVVATAEISLEELCAQVVTAGSRVLEFCERAKAHGVDVDELKRGIAALEP
jgi:hypothetical protein